jgi:hypothetical protein
VAHSHGIQMDLHLGLDHPRRLRCPNPETPSKIARWDDLEVEGVQLVFGLSPVGVLQVKAPLE